jgi:hypothetical protein
MRKESEDKNTEIHSLSQLLHFTLSFLQYIQ